ncbi:hypothetical protein LNO88_06600 [Klebsiella pneumoniae subsp. pneumoniae]|nr:hypothetical protein [Klebsiella pneumoniae subsp. pneumoniae]
MQPFINIDLGGRAQPLLKVNHLLKYFSRRQRPGGGAGGGRYQLHGDERRNPGVVGESGCGKSDHRPAADRSCSPRTAAN